MFGESCLYITTAWLCMRVPEAVHPVGLKAQAGASDLSESTRLHPRNAGCAAPKPQKVVYCSGQALFPSTRSTHQTAYFSFHSHLLLSLAPCRRSAILVWDGLSFGLFLNRICSRTTAHELRAYKFSSAWFRLRNSAPLSCARDPRMSTLAWLGQNASQGH